ncbi:hypothetical protein [[Phormidium ambiguum] IAM M-71]|uniref:hypothetical protein n=1 Tax=[Phormidium ambiguum] IAM M-71 TaxID=454136 RepID=UPI0015BAA81E|nr:hypothetical protein [Phormidium ambiguum]
MEPLQVLIARLHYLISSDTLGTGYGWTLGLVFTGIGLGTSVIYVILLMSSNLKFSIF